MLNLGHFYNFDYMKRAVWDYINTVPIIILCRMSVWHTQLTITINIIDRTTFTCDELSWINNRRPLIIVILYRSTWKCVIKCVSCASFLKRKILKKLRWRTFKPVRITAFFGLDLDCPYRLPESLVQSYCTILVNSNYYSSIARAMCIGIIICDSDTDDRWKPFSV